MSVPRMKTIGSRVGSLVVVAALTARCGTAAPPNMGEPMTDVPTIKNDAGVVNPRDGPVVPPRDVVIPSDSGSSRCTVAPNSVPAANQRPRVDHVRNGEIISIATASGNNLVKVGVYDYNDTLAPTGQASAPRLPPNLRHVVTLSPVRDPSSCARGTPPCECTEEPFSGRSMRFYEGNFPSILFPEFRADDVKVQLAFVSSTGVADLLLFRPPSIDRYTQVGAVHIPTTEGTTVSMATITFTSQGTPDFRFLGDPARALLAEGSISGTVVPMTILESRDPVSSYCMLGSTLYRFQSRLPTGGSDASVNVSSVTF
ncbi:hypothetical protein HY990_00870 [Candidatus Micrarchaeota archaeon]|nr:hypothetical protein [Candidatus Micrarchaeota archaeon]